MVSSLRLVERSGGSRRAHLDFVVDGEPLTDRLAPVLGDYVAALVLDWPIGFPATDYGYLTGELPAPLPGGRVPLYICPECGDLGCGGVTAVVERTPETVVWRDFGYQNDYDPFEPDPELAHVGPIVFDRQAYDDALARFRDRWPTASG